MSIRQSGCGGSGIGRKERRGILNKAAKLNVRLPDDCWEHSECALSSPRPGYRGSQSWKVPTLSTIVESPSSSPKSAVHNGTASRMATSPTNVMSNLQRTTICSPRKTPECHRVVNRASPSSSLLSQKYDDEEGAHLISSAHSACKSLPNFDPRSETLVQQFRQLSLARSNVPLSSPTYKARRR